MSVNLNCSDDGCQQPGESFAGKQVGLTRSKHISSDLFSLVRAYCVRGGEATNEWVEQQ